MPKQDPRFNKDRKHGISHELPSGHQVGPDPWHITKQAKAATKVQPPPPEVVGGRESEAPETVPKKDKKDK